MTGLTSMETAGTGPTPQADELFLRREAAWGLLWFILYAISLCFTLESEYIHWGTLVLLPLLAVYLHRRSKDPGATISSTLETFGVRRRWVGEGVLVASIAGLALCALQLVFSRSNARILELLGTGKVFYLFPLAFALMLVTAGFTEEFFFRGFLQTRLRALFRSRVAAVIATSLVFGLYHLPYAYFHPAWPSHGNMTEAISSAFGQGIPVGLVLGAVYERYGQNLLPCVIIHSMLNAVPAMLFLSGPT